MITGKLLDDNGEEITIQSAWGLKKVILTMDEFAEMKLSINGRYVEDYVYKMYTYNGTEVTRVVGGKKQTNDAKTVVGYHETIYDAIDYIERITGVIGDVKYVDYTYDEGNESIVYTIRTEEGFVFDIVEQERRVLIWR